jgi:hypothetical protein
VHESLDLSDAQAVACASQAMAAIGDVRANGQLDMVNGAHASVSSQASASAIADLGDF